VVYITGDTHREFDRIKKFCKKNKTTKDDILIITGDAGINYFGGEDDRELKKELSTLPITMVCVRGNHERRPEEIETYQIKMFADGIVYYEKNFENLLFAKDGEIYTFNSKKYMVIGGAYSVDKPHRISRGWHWFPNEQLDSTEKSLIEAKLESMDLQIYGILSHTCPQKFTPKELFLPGIDQSKVDTSMEDWLDSIEDKLSYEKWYCGHYHTNKNVNKMRFLFTDIIEL